MAVWGGLTNSCEKKRMKSKGEKERFIYFNVEFQRISERVRKSSSAINAKKQKRTIEWERLESIQKIRHTKGTFLAKMGSIKNRNGMELTEAEDIKRSQEYTEELYKKHFHDLDNHNGVITQSHLEPDILE